MDDMIEICLQQSNIDLEHDIQLEKLWVQVCCLNRFYLVDIGGFNIFDT
jgi:hypothetical protein